MRPAVIALTMLALVLFALCEVGLAYPVAGWLYLSVAVAFAATLIRPMPILRRRRSRMSALIVIMAVVAALYFVEWTSRKPFLRDLSRVHAGMTEPEVRRIMGRYMEGTGWPAPPGTLTNSSSTLTSLSSGSQYATITSPSGKLALRDSLVFRHSDDGAFNSDWGIVSLSNGVVVSVEFSPD